MCTKQGQDREKCIQPPVSHALSDYNICHGVRPLGHHVKNWDTLYIRLFTISVDIELQSPLRNSTLHNTHIGVTIIPFDYKLAALSLSWPELVQHCNKIMTIPTLRADTKVWSCQHASVSSTCSILSILCVSNGVALAVATQDSDG